MTRRRDARAARRFLCKLLKGQGGSPWQLVTDQLGSYAAARRDPGLTAAYRIGRHENNRTEVSHQHSRGRERHMRRFKPAGAGAAISGGPCGHRQRIPSRASSPQDRPAPRAPLVFPRPRERPSGSRDAGRPEHPRSRGRREDRDQPEHAVPLVPRGRARRLHRAARGGPA